MTTAQHAAEAAPATGPALEIEGLRVVAGPRDGEHELLRGVDLVVPARCQVGLVGESGSGKSMTASAVLRLMPAGVRVTGGRITLAGRELTAAAEREMRAVRGGELGLIQQNALSALNPLFPVGVQIAAVARAHLAVSRAQAKEMARELLDQLGVPDPARRARDYPHQFSGGMAQRVAIALALVCRPKVLIADEPTTGLDATIQLQVLEAIDRSVRQSGASLLLISHDLAAVAAVTDRIAVMYCGMILECGPTAQVMDAPLSPYTQGLVACARPGADSIPFIPGRVPDPHVIGEGCPFADRCPMATARCREETPRARADGTGRLVACHHAELP